MFGKVFGISFISSSILKRISRLGKVKEFLPFFSILLSNYWFDLLVSFLSVYVRIMASCYKRVLTDLDLLLLKCTHVTLSHVIWSILFRNQMMISRRQEDLGQNEGRLMDHVKLWEMVDFLINLLALIIQVCFKLSQ